MCRHTHTRARTHTHATYNVYVHTYSQTDTHTRMYIRAHAARSVFPCPNLTPPLLLLLLFPALALRTLRNCFDSRNASVTPKTSKFIPPPVTRYETYERPLRVLALKRVRFMFRSKITGRPKTRRYDLYFRAKNYKNARLLPTLNY